MKLIHITITALTVSLMSFTPHAFAADKGTIGISMPTKSSARWIADGDNIVKILRAKGYKTDLQYAEGDIPNQLAQIENMITTGDKVLVIAAIDGTTLSDALQKATNAGVKIIAYDRLIRGSPNGCSSQRYDHPFASASSSPVERVEINRTNIQRSAERSIRTSGL
jgi:putative multiple sugar transport system substrate-binding protein